MKTSSTLICGYVSLITMTLTYNFYNFPYAFGLLFAKGLYAKYLKDSAEFVGTYDELLKATGKNTLENVAKLVNIDVTSIDFWRSSLEIIEEDIDEFLKLSSLGL